jgi:hypothetical protein
MIEPTPGRIVWFRSKRETETDVLLWPPTDGQPMAAIIAHVVNRRLVHLCVIGVAGATVPRPNCILLQGDDRPPYDESYAEWMPFQRGQAKAQEQEAENLRRIDAEEQMGIFRS